MDICKRNYCKIPSVLLSVNSASELGGGGVVCTDDFVTTVVTERRVRGSGCLTVLDIVSTILRESSESSSVTSPTTSSLPGLIFCGMRETTLFALTDSVKCSTSPPDVSGLSATGPDLPIISRTRFSADPPTCSPNFRELSAASAAFADTTSVTCVSFEDFL